MDKESLIRCGNLWIWLNDTAWHWRIDMKDYHINIFYSEEDGGYIADIPDLAHYSGFGTTPEEALLQALIAKKVWLEAARAEGKSIPRPRYRPAIYQLSSSIHPPQ